MMKLSVAIITLNEEKILDKTLASVKDIADEIVIIDSGSTDNTENIAQKHGAKFYHQDWLGYGNQKNVAIEKCQYPWILNIDADEEVSPQLAKKIQQIKENSKYDVYNIKYISVCFNKKIKHGGWSNSYHIKLFKKNSGHFNDKKVHESFVTDCDIGIIKEPYYHHTYTDLADYFTKFNRYTTEGAEDYYRRKRKFNILQMTVNPWFKFIKMYILRLGFLDGKEGFLLASTSSMYTMVKYYKLYEIYRSNNEKDNSIKN